MDKKCKKSSRILHMFLCPKRTLGALYLFFVEAIETNAADHIMFTNTSQLTSFVY